jgi:site-specific DNA-methyltransferase (adenine-specific)
LGSQKTILNKPFISEEKSACSYSFIYIGYDKEYSDEELNNILLYIKTKFFRFLISLKKSAIDCSRKVYKFVPIQDFNEEWSDEKLYKKYNLSDEEIKYIEDNIKEME